MLIKVTADQLYQAGMDDDQVKLFQAEWPDGFLVTEQSLRRAVALGLGVDWAIAYIEAIPSVRQAYIEAISPARQIHKEATYLPCQSYNKVDQLARQTYYETMRHAQQVHLETVRPFEQSYDEAKLIALAAVCSDATGIKSRVVG